MTSLPTRLEGAAAGSRELDAVCSAKPRPSVQNNHAKGLQWWARDVYHLTAEPNRTLCGRDSSEWLVIGPVEKPDSDCCKRCAAIARATEAQP